MTVGHERPRPEIEDWRDQAACAGMDPAMFFPDDHTNVHRDVRRACASCPVRELCLEYALANEPHGFWGGLSAVERRSLKRRRRRARRLAATAS